MNSKLVTIILTIALASAAASAAAGQEKAASLAPAQRASVAKSAVEDKQAERIIKQLEGEFLTASLKGDTAALGRMLADEYTFSPPNGSVISKENYIALLESGTLKYEVMELVDTKVRVFSDAAIASSRVNVKGVVGTHVINGQDRSLTVYVKRQGRWQPVASQAARIAQQLTQ